MVWTISYGPYKIRLEPYCFVPYSEGYPWPQQMDYADAARNYSTTMLWFAFKSIHPLYTGLVIVPFTQGFYICLALCSIIFL